VPGGAGVSVHAAARAPVRAGRTWRLQDPELLVFDLAAMALAAAVAFAVARAPLGSGDYGQWLMVSRFFTGEDIPEYRNAWGVAPLIPMFLAAVRFVTGDPYVALNVVRVTLIVALVLSFYVAAGALFRSRGAGLLAAVFAVIVTDRFMDLVAFGGRAHGRLRPLAERRPEVAHGGAPALAGGGRPRRRAGLLARRPRAREQRLRDEPCQPELPRARPPLP
jgi:hypothetical protein